MLRDKYSAIWLSYSSLSDYNKCPRSYFLKNIYRNPKTRKKIALMQPALALGQAVHAVFEELSVLPVQDRFSVSLTDRYLNLWLKISGQKGGFRDREEEDIYKKRGLLMMKRATMNPGPLSMKAVKLRQDLPYYWFSDNENFILCGKIDWLIYDEKNDAVQVLDFKTGKTDEDSESLQLPIYALLITHVQTRKLSGLKYWYLERDNEPLEMTIPDLSLSEETIMELAKRIELARKLNRFVCPKTEGCMFCHPYEMIIKGEAIFVGTDNFNQEVYILN